MLDHLQQEGSSTKTELSGIHFFYIILTIIIIISFLFGIMAWWVISFPLLAWGVSYLLLCHRKNLSVVKNQTRVHVIASFVQLYCGDLYQYPIYNQEEYDEDISLWRYRITIESEQYGIQNIYAYFTEEKAKLIQCFIKTYLEKRYETTYLFLVKFYEKYQVLYDIDLVENFDYPESFVKKFTEIKERI